MGTFTFQSEWTQDTAQVQQEVDTYELGSSDIWTALGRSASADGDPVAFYAINKASGATYGVLGDGSGGGVTAKMLQDQLDAINALLVARPVTAIVLKRAKTPAPALRWNPSAAPTSVRPNV